MRKRLLLVVLMLVTASASVSGSASASPRELDPQIQAKVLPNSIVLGSSALVTGLAAPADYGPVVVQRGIHGKWSNRQSGQVAADGTFKIAIRPTQAGIYALRVAFVRDPESRSAVFYLRVRLLPSQTIRATDWSRLPIPKTACGGSDAALYVDPKKVWYGDMTGDGNEEAALVVDCFVAEDLYWNQLLLYGMSSGAPKLLTSFHPDSVAPAHDWSATVTSAAISGRKIRLVGTVVPVGGCHACSTRAWSATVSLRNGALTAS